MKKLTHKLFILVLCAMMGAACDESLPPRDQPENVFLPTMEAGYGYVSRTEDGIYLTLIVRNTYTETFSDSADIYGNITIQWKDQPAYQKHFTLTAANFTQVYFNPATNMSVVTQSSYNPSTHILTIPENEYAVFQVFWNLVTDDSMNVRSNVQYHRDLINPNLFVTDDLTFVVTSGVHLYRKIPMLYPEMLVFKQSLRHS